jgi:hypothetical protein
MADCNLQYVWAIFILLPINKEFSVELIQPISQLHRFLVLTFCLLSGFLLDVQVTSSTAK